MSSKVIWITGLSGAGKTTLAKELILRLEKTGVKPILLDGDVLRDILKSPNQEIDGHSRDARIELALKYAKLCKGLSSQGFTVVIATISMFTQVYAWNRLNLPDYFEVYLKVPLEELRRRDPKCIYERYDNGNLKNVSGLDLAVDEPYNPNLILDFETNPSIWLSPSNLVEYLMSRLTK